MSAAVKLALVPTSGERPRPDERSDVKIVAGVAAAAAVYATVRYNLFKGVPWADWPGYVFNKVLAVTALVLLAFAAVRKLRGIRPSATLMTWGGGAALGHLLLSFGLFQPENFDKLFAGGKLTLAGGLSLATGAIAYVLLEVGARRSGEWSPRAGIGVLVLLVALGAIHTAVPAAQTWLKPASWPGYLPPLTLLTVAPACLPIALWLRDEIKRILHR